MFEAGKYIDGFWRGVSTVSTAHLADVHKALYRTLQGLSGVSLNPEVELIPLSQPPTGPLSQSSQILLSILVFAGFGS